jgi:hypothetical protein
LSFLWSLRQSQALLFLHRGWFARALRDHPDEPLRSKSSQSYVAELECVPFDLLSFTIDQVLSLLVLSLQSLQDHSLANSRPDETPGTARVPFVPFSQNSSTCFFLTQSERLSFFVFRLVVLVVPSLLCLRLPRCRLHSSPLVKSRPLCPARARARRLPVRSRQGWLSSSR